jgi:hypothetical protein
MLCPDVALDGARSPESAGRARFQAARASGTNCTALLQILEWHCGTREIPASLQAATSSRGLSGAKHPRSARKDEQKSARSRTDPGGFRPVMFEP